MPLAGCLDIRPLLEGAPATTIDERELRIDDVDILQVLHEIRAGEIESMLPPALNPTIPPVIGFLVYRARQSPFGPFALAQARLTARAGVRTRAFLLSAYCDNPTLAEVLSGSFGWRLRPGEVSLRRFHDRVDCTVVGDGVPVLEIGLVDPQPVTGHDIQYAPGMHLAHVSDAHGTRPRLVQVETEYEFRRADRGRPRLVAFDAAAWGEERVQPTEAISASFTACDVTITPVRYVCNPDLPASEGTERVGSL